jgi:uncharacterized protein
VVLALAGAPRASHADEAPIPPSPAEYVTDGAGFLSPAARQALSARLEAYARTSGPQVLVWIGRTTGDTPVEDFAERSFRAWGVGNRARDDGAVLFILADDRKMRIEVGYGLEDRVPDLVASRIIREAIAPRLQAGDRDGAVTAGVDALLAAISREGPTAPATGYGRPAPRPLSLGQKILFGLIGLFLLWLVVTHPALVYYLLVNILSSSSGGGSYRGGGWGGGGGGYSGGGGRSGGGGASGSW